MQYENICRGTFLARPNRFIAHVQIGGETVICHVKNTGRCRELLIPGAAVYLQACDKAERKTKFDLIAVEKGERLVNMDAQAPNKVFGEWAAAGCFVPGLKLLRPETVYGKSRFDFYWESERYGSTMGPSRPTGTENGGAPGLRPADAHRGFVEVKGVTLEEGGAAYFPDAPTERGVKHVEELISCHEAGYEACLFLVIQTQGVDFWSPNDKTHPAFGDAVRRAAENGVRILAYDCRVTPERLDIDREIEVRL